MFLKWCYRYIDGLPMLPYHLLSRSQRACPKFSKLLVLFHDNDWFRPSCYFHWALTILNNRLIWDMMKKINIDTGWNNTSSCQISKLLCWLYFRTFCYINKFTMSCYLCFRTSHRCVSGLRELGAKHGDLWYHQRDGRRTKRRCESFAEASTAKCWKELHCSHVHTYG